MSVSLLYFVVPALCFLMTFFFFLFASLFSSLRLRGFSRPRHLLMNSNIQLYIFIVFACAKRRSQSMLCCSSSRSVESNMAMFFFLDAQCLLHDIEICRPNAKLSIESGEEYVDDTTLSQVDNATFLSQAQQTTSHPSQARPATLHLCPTRPATLHLPHRWHPATEV